MYNSNIPTTEEFMDVMKAFLSKPSKKRVSFATDVSTTTPGPLHFDELKDLWYGTTDLKNFKLEAKKVVSDVREAKDLSGYELRGLENCTAERQKHKYMSIRCTISASRRGLRTDQLASIAQKCTAWNQETAFLQACHDFCDVYRPSMAHSIPQVIHTPPKFPFVMRKRVVTDASASQRRTRRRVNPVF
jgi:hypothetical protein